MLRDKLDNLSDRNWYAATAAEHGWSRNVLHNQINSGLRRRIGAAPSNFQDQIPAEDSDLVQELVRDPYVFDFLDITERVGRTCTGICTDALAGAVSPQRHPTAWTDSTMVTMSNLPPAPPGQAITARDFSARKVFRASDSPRPTVLDRLSSTSPW
ncbi:hypothetical protein V2B23_30470 [Rhodococcus sp. 24CO]